MTVTLVHNMKRCHKCYNHPVVTVTTVMTIFKIQSADLDDGRSRLWRWLTRARGYEGLDSRSGRRHTWVCGCVCKELGDDLGARLLLQRARQRKILCSQRLACDMGSSKLATIDLCLQAPTVAALPPTSATTSPL
ncbi:hypothetical protein TIFTF001_038743 [Ficus carica]|uniref:Uncharacterized protein n=1 Tax=Ficus carica TaxID=3494 RepID=A0AA88JE80_FICCA|nr:hypothetical protein TIFTF001_038743 [Ficus carica]